MENNESIKNKARKIYGIKSDVFDKYNLESQPFEDILTYFESVAAKSEINMAREERLIWEVVNASSLDYAAAKAKMLRAVNRYGINYTMFIKYNLADVAEDQMIEAFQASAAPKELQYQRREKNIRTIARESGMKRAQVIAEVKNLGVLPIDYLNNRLWSLDEEEKKQAVERIKHRYERRKFNRDTTRILAVNDAMREMHWDADTAEKSINICREKGITPKQYRRYKLYQSSPEEWLAIVKRREANQKAYAAKERHDNLVLIAEKAGWDFETAEAKYNDAYNRTGCRTSEYLNYKFYQMPEEEQNNVFLWKHSALMASHFDANPEIYLLLRDKEKSNIALSKYMNRNWCMTSNVTFEEFEEKFANARKIVYKPISGNGGYGVFALDISPENVREVYEQLTSMDTGIVEQYVFQHPDMAKFSPNSVNTIRVVSVTSQDRPLTEDGKHTAIAYIALKIGSGKTVADNFHFGGLLVHVDKETGLIATDAVDLDLNLYETHPVTGVKFKGTKIPYFEEAINLVHRVIDEMNIQGYFGWDIAISEDGPVLIELNDGPGANLFSTPYAAKKIGRKDVILQYLK